MVLRTLSESKKLKDRISKFLQKLLGRKELEIQIPDEWVSQQPNLVKEKHGDAKPITIKYPKRNIPRIWKMPSLVTRIKRVLAGLVFIVNILLVISSFMFNIIMGVYFLLNAFFILDYLWKTRKKVKWEEDQRNDGETILQ